jgi:threonyl-tRNA synthetase
MKILTIHADFIEFEAKKKAFKGAEENIEEGPHKVDECLVVFTAVEKKDESNKLEIIQKYVQEIKNIAQQVNAKNLVLYPYAHLSSQLSNPKVAEEVMKEAEKILKEKFTVSRAPFGWYKSFNVSCKGHPLSELSREFSVKKDNESDTEFIEEFDTETLMKQMSKVNMQAPRGKNDMKSNVELGKELDIYFVSEIVGSGLPLLTSKGATIKRELERFVTDEELKRGYLHTSTPIMAKSDLYKVSGHWQHYRKDMFTLQVRDETFALRPMTCPFHFIIYKHKQRSYKDLPLKYAEIAQLFRNEQSGELRGLTRVRQFSLADAHIICRPDQFENEFNDVVSLIKFMMEKLGIEVWFRFSKWDPANKEKYIDNPKGWEESQSMMQKCLDSLNLDYKEAIDEAAFYGPKLDMQYLDVYGKEDTLITVQIDFSAPDRFDLTYTDKDDKEKRPIVIHRSSAGCTERTMAYLLEKTQGKLPLWLNPLQVKVVTITDDNVPFAQEIIKKLFDENIRVELDDRSESMGKKVAEAVSEKVNYIVTIGDKEVEKKTLAVRGRDGKTIFDVTVENFVEHLKKEIIEKKID